MTAGTDGARTTTLPRLVLLTLEGYFYLGLIVGVFLAGPAFLIWGLLTRRPFVAIAAILVGVPLAATTARAIRALWCPFREPEGVEVGPHLGAALHREVHGTGTRIRAPIVHRILITDAHNASALQAPRAGVFWPRNILCLGYPLLATLSVEQIRAVIVHELGHMTHGHGRVASWVHRTRLSWMRLLYVLERHQSVPAHVYLLFRHYVPRLNAHAAAISRQQELLADRLAAEAIGPEVAGQTLMAIEIVDYILSERFWPRIHERVADDPEPPDPFSLIGPGIWNDVDDRDALVKDLIALDASDTHPALRDRLRALHQRPEWPPPVRVPATEYFLGPQMLDVAATLAARWQAQHRDEWTRRHGAIRTRRDRLAQLTALPSPSPEETFERARLTESEGDTGAALQLFVSAHERGHAEAGLAAGRLLLERDDEAGVALIDAAIETSPRLAEDGCTAIIEFLDRRGRRAEAYQYRMRMTRQVASIAMADTERTTLSAVDRLRPVDDPRIDVPALAGRLAMEPGIVRAFLAAKELRYSTGTQTVMAVRANGGSPADLRDRLCRDGLLPNDVIVATLGSHERILETALGAATLIFDSTFEPDTPRRSRPS